jgi:hypothetical protein
METKASWMGTLLWLNVSQKQDIILWKLSYGVSPFHQYHNKGTASSVAARILTVIDKEIAGAVVVTKLSII